MKPTIVSLARFQAARGHGEELGLRLCELLLRARADTACLGCELERQGEGWLLRGHWASPQALEAHLQLPHMQALGRLLGGGLVRRLQLSLAPPP